MMFSESFIKDKNLKNLQIKYLAIQGSYNQVEIALYNNLSCLTCIKIENLKASSNLIPMVQEILNKNNINLKDLSFISVDKGPGAFTSLRVIISTVNGIAYASKIPLIGIDGLDALALEAFENLYLDKPTQPDILISLLNAYNNDVYYSINLIKNNDLIINPEIKDFKGYKKIEKLIEDLKENFDNKKIVFTGNGFLLHKDLLEQNFKENLIIPKNLFLFASAKQIALMGLKDWINQENISYKIEPIYLKSQNFAIRPLIDKK